MMHLASKIGPANRCVVRKTASERVLETFLQWKRKQVPDRTAFYHTALDIRYRRGGLPERAALVRLRYRRSNFRAKVVTAWRLVVRRWYG
jgi:hypothetical protein